MNDDIFKMEIRKFLKKVGITSQIEIEQAVLTAIEQGSLKGNEKLDVHMTLTIPALKVTHEIDSQIALEE